MRKRDTFEVLTSLLAVVCDAVAFYAGFMLAVWLRLYSGWFPVHHYPALDLYLYGAGVATLLMVFIFRMLGLYERPQLGHFIEKVPRLVRAVGLGILLAIAMAFIIRTETPFSRGATAISFVTVSLLVLLERDLLFQLERHWAKHQAQKRNVLILGTGHFAVRLKESLAREHRLRSEVIGFFSLNGETVDPAIPADKVLGGIETLPEVLEREAVDEVLLANSSALTHDQMVGIIIECEKNLASFFMVPDMFRLLTSSVRVQSVDGMPLLGVGQWPLDRMWNRVLKRTEDVVGALVGLLLSAPVIALAAPFIKRDSPGPVFYAQERCGEKGKTFQLYKLRTMPLDAEKESGPVWTTEDDPRTTRFGAFLRRFNLDELPQFWNVLKGEMSLVGPRPERPHFVEQFKDDVGQYMIRHVSRPGMTGWAQVNGYRGNTSLEKRVRHDLYYLENWSLSLDFKVLAKTLYRRENAY